MPAISLTPLSISSRTEVSADQFDQAQFEEAILDTLRKAQYFHELIITDVSLGWADSLWELEDFERSLRMARKSYDPRSRTLRLKMKLTSYHNCILQWITNSIGRAYIAGFLSLAEYNLICLGSGISKFLSLTLCVTC